MRVAESKQRPQVHVARCCLGLRRCLAACGQLSLCSVEGHHSNLLHLCSDPICALIPACCPPCPALHQLPSTHSCPHCSWSSWAATLWSWRARRSTPGPRPSRGWTPTTSRAWWRRWGGGQPGAWPGLPEQQGPWRTMVCCRLHLPEEHGGGHGWTKHLTLVLQVNPGTCIHVCPCLLTGRLAHLPPPHLLL